MLDDLLGHKRDIKSYKEGRKCKICKKDLSIYNSTEYCFVHGLEGEELEDEKKQKKLRQIIKKHKRGKCHKSA